MGETKKSTKVGWFSKNYFYFFVKKNFQGSWMISKNVFLIFGVLVIINESRFDSWVKKYFKETTF